MMTMKKRIILILVSLMFFMATLGMPVKKAEAFWDLGVGVGLVIMFFGGSFIQFHNYPECRKEVSIGDMAKCIEQVKEDREAKELKKK